MNLTRNIDERPPRRVPRRFPRLPERDADREAENCYGPRPELLLRLAVVDVGGTTVIAWARMNRSNIDETFVAMFELMLSIIRFR